MDLGHPDRQDDVWTFFYRKPAGRWDLQPAPGDHVFVAERKEDFIAFICCAYKLSTFCQKVVLYSLRGRLETQGEEFDER